MFIPIHKSRNVYKFEKDANPIKKLLLYYTELYLLQYAEIVNEVYGFNNHWVSKVKDHKTKMKWRAYKT